MAKSTEQLDGPNTNVHNRLIAVLREMRDVRKGEKDLVTFEVVSTTDVADEVRAKVKKLFANE